MEKYFWLNSLYTDGSKYFVSNPHPKVGETITIKLRVKHNEDIDTVILRTKHHGEQDMYELRLLETKHGLDYYATEVTMTESLFHYHFYIVAGSDIYYYSQYQLQDFVPDEGKDFKILVNYDAPEWVKSSVFYQILPDRFHESKPEIGVKAGQYTLNGQPTKTYDSWNEPAMIYADGRNVDFFNGDLYGIIEKLDYLQELGINAIYLNPIFLSPSSHKFDTLDFFEVDPHLGGNEAFAELMDEVHKRDMKLVLDVSIDHTSIDAKWFNRDGTFFPTSVGAYNNPDAPERELYLFNDDGTYQGWNNVKTMPKLNFHSETVRNILYKSQESVVKTWLQEPYKIDGWRFDVSNVMARDSDYSFYFKIWQDIYNEVKATNPDAYIVGEDWTDSSNLLHQNGYDAAMNYFGFTRPVREFLGEVDLYSEYHPLLAKVNPHIDARKLKLRLEQGLSTIPYQVALQQFNLLDSHDIGRTHNNSIINMDEYRGALIALYTFPGTPNVYYGDERLLDGRYERHEGARFPMQWDEITDPEAQSIFDLNQQLIELKREESALIDGGYKTIYSEGDCLVYARFSDEKTYLTVFSTESHDVEIALDISVLGHGSASKIVEALDQEVTFALNGDELIIQVPAHQSYLLEISN